MDKGKKSLGELFKNTSTQYKAFLEMPRDFSHFMKCSIELVISERD